METIDFNEIDQYVDSILKNIPIDSIIIDMNEIDKYVDTLLKKHNIIEDYEVIELIRRPTIHHKNYKKKKSKQCSVQ